MTYVDAFVVPVPEGNREAFRQKAQQWAALYKEFGALEVFDAWGNELKRGQVTDFYMAVKAEDGENVVLSCITWPSKEVRDAAWGRIMSDERMRPAGEMPFDGRRMFSGGFEPLHQQ